LVCGWIRELPFEEDQKKITEKTKRRGEKCHAVGIKVMFLGLVCIVAGLLQALVRVPSVLILQQCQQQ
jgi:hypothetical protein